MTEIKYLSTEDLLNLAGLLGVLDVRDLGLLDSAALRPQSVVYGTESYPMLADKAAALFESIVGNHPLIDETNVWGGPHSYRFTHSMESFLSWKMMWLTTSLFLLPRDKLDI